MKVWQRVVSVLGLDLDKYKGPGHGNKKPVSEEGKHYKAKQKPHNWRQKRKVKRLMTKASRRKNR